MTNIPHPPSSQETHTSLARELLRQLEQQEVANTARQQDLSEAKHEAQSWRMRRAARNERDKGCYQTGAALEPNKGHLIDPVFLSGLDHLGRHGLVLLLKTAVDHPEETSLSGLMHRLSYTAAGTVVREWGEWSRRVWLAGLYWDQTVAFLQSKKGSDPKEAWRKEPLTAEQAYLAGEIGRICRQEVPPFPTRGDAFEWIKERGGNPRFRVLPLKPLLPTLQEVCW